MGSTALAEKSEAGASEDAVNQIKLIIEQTIEETRPVQARFFFERTVSVRPYETQKAGHSWPYTVLEDESDEENRRRALHAENMAKALTYGALGLDMAIEESDAGPRIVEIFAENVKAAMPGTETVAAAPSTAPAVSAGPTNAGPPHDPVPLRKPKKSMTDLEKAMSAENESWARERFGTNPEEFHDNRNRKASGEIKSNAPDVKHKSTEIPVWSL